MSPAIPDNEHPADEVDPIRDAPPRPGAADPHPGEATGSGTSRAGSAAPPTPDPAGTTPGPDASPVGPDGPVGPVGPDGPPVGSDSSSVGHETPASSGSAADLPGPPGDNYLLAYDRPVPVRTRAPWRTLAVAVATVLVIVLLGVPLGLVWRAVAPSVPVIQADGGAVLAQPQPEEFVAADGWFSLFGLIFGLLAAIAVWLVLRRYRGPAGMVLVALGSIGAAVVAWQVGRQIGLDEYHRMLETATAGTGFGKPPDLRAGRFEWLFGFIPALRGDLLMPAFGAVVMYTMLAGWSRYAGLGVEPEPVGVSWDSVALPAPPPAPAPPAPGAAEPPRD